MVQIILNLDDFLSWWEHFLLWKEKENLEKKIFGSNLHSAKSGVISFQWLWLGGGGVFQKIKVASGFEIFEIRWNFRNFVSGPKQARQQPYKHHSDQISRSAREAARLKVYNNYSSLTWRFLFLVRTFLGNRGIFSNVQIHYGPSIRRSVGSHQWECFRPASTSVFHRVS